MVTVLRHGLAADPVDAPPRLLSPTATTHQSTGAAGSFTPVLSRDGRRVAFTSEASNLVTNDDRQPHLDVFLRDLTSGETALVSVNLAGVGGGSGNSTAPAISSAGRHVAFESTGPIWWQSRTPTGKAMCSCGT